MALYPPSLSFTPCQRVPFAPALPGTRAGEPLSCNPPRMTPGSLGCCANETNSLSEPILLFKLSNGFVPAQLEDASAVSSSARHTPPSFPKYTWIGSAVREKSIACWSGCTCDGAPRGEHP